MEQKGKMASCEFIPEDFGAQTHEDYGTGGGLESQCLLKTVARVNVRHDDHSLDLRDRLAVSLLFPIDSLNLQVRRAKAWGSSRSRFPRQPLPLRPLRQIPVPHRPSG